MSYYMSDPVDILKGAAGGAAAGGAAADPVYEIDPRDVPKGGVEGGGFYLSPEAQAMIESRNTGPSVLLLLAVGFGAYLLTLAINPSLPSFGSSSRSSSRRSSSRSKPSWAR